jgi:mannose-6-phosphate isomerase-like protein (cupin superfamily)
MDNKIQKYQISGDGYHPFLIREGWQVAQLNYSPDQNILNIAQIDVHRETDEVFVALKGHAVLIAATIDGDKVTFDLEYLQPGLTYNVPKNLWHNIAMQPGSEVLIVEKSNTHLSDVEYFKLSDNQQQELHTIVHKAFDKTKTHKKQ